MGEPERPAEPAEDPHLTRTLAFGVAPDARPAPRIEGPSFLVIEVVGGPMDGLGAHVEGDALTIGRGRDNDLALVLDSAVSKTHARIEREGNHFWLEDADSSNGTYIGDRRIEERVLIGAGTSFTVGQTHLEFMPT